MRNNVGDSSFSFYQENKQTSESSSTKRPRDFDVLAIFHNENNEVLPLEAIIDVGASTPIVSQCALDSYRSSLQKEYPEVCNRVVSSPISLQLRVANGETLRSAESVCVPVRIDLSDEFSQTAFAVTNTGSENIPFLVAMPQLSRLDIMINIKPGHEYMTSRSSGVAYKLRKPRQHLLWNMLQGPMMKLKEIPKHIDVDAVWRTPGKRRVKHEKKSPDRKTHFR